MSWSTTTPDACVAPDSLGDVAALTVTDATPGVELQLGVAKEAACSLISSGALGDPSTTRTRTTLSGHAADQLPGVENAAPPSVTVSVSVVPG